MILGSGIGAERLTHVRCTGALAGLALILLVRRPAAFAVSARELPFLAAFGIGGLALVQWSYFYAIHPLTTSVSPACERTSASQIRRPTGSCRTERAKSATMIGARYILIAERGVRRRDPISFSCYEFLFAALFWAVLQPWWSFPGGRVGRDVLLLGNLAGSHLPIWVLTLWMVVLGTVVPFAVLVGALRHVSATRAGIVAVLEPVVPSLVAWARLREALASVQLGGAALTLAGIVLRPNAQ